MNDSLKDIVSNQFNIFILEFADPAQVQITYSFKDLMNTQKKADQAKRELGKDGFKQVLSLYFDQFKDQSGVDYVNLHKCLTNNEKVLIRHLGKDKVMYIRLIVELSEALAKDERPKRGLLGVA